MTLDQLHQRYGQAMIQLEILQNQVMEIKKQIAEEMQKPRKNETPDNIASPDNK
jgi:uncharacterized protein involved in exopolysaccharide biosynthesis